MYLLIRHHFHSIIINLNVSWMKNKNIYCTDFNCCTVDVDAFNRFCMSFYIHPFFLDWYASYRFGIQRSFHNTVPSDASTADANTKIFCTRSGVMFKWGFIRKTIKQSKFHVIKWTTGGERLDIWIVVQLLNLLELVRGITCNLKLHGQLRSCSRELRTISA